MYLLSKVNTKWITQNIDKMKYRLKLLGRSLELIITNSKSWNTTKQDYLQRGLMSTIWDNIALIIDITKNNDRETWKMD